MEKIIKKTSVFNIVTATIIIISALIQLYLGGEYINYRRIRAILGYFIIVPSLLFTTVGTIIVLRYYLLNGFKKPYKYFYEYICSVLKKKYRKNINKNKILVIGDNLNTDISGANNFNVKNLFIAGGIHKPEWSKKNISLANFVIEKNKYFKINYFQNELIW